MFNMYKLQYRDLLKIDSQWIDWRDSEESKEVSKWVLLKQAKILKDKYPYNYFRYVKMY